MKKPTCTLFIKMCTCTFFFFLFIHTSTKRKKKKNAKKKKTGNSYNLIADHFHVKQFPNLNSSESKRNFFFFFFDLFFFKRGSFRSAQVGKAERRIVYF